ncbi:hypothetical protein [Marinomonas sp. THO17]|uniref:hypothetical protein n=1 Tax=Marinomonas sp. THO17 TaxID=3149048 RepID=UPI00336BE7D1
MRYGFYGVMAFLNMVPSYGKQLNQIEDIEGDSKVIHSSLQEMVFDQCDSLFKELDKWNECLEKPSVNSFVELSSDKEY